MFPRELSSKHLGVLQEISMGYESCQLAVSAYQCLCPLQLGYSKLVPLARLWR